MSPWIGSVIVAIGSLLGIALGWIVTQRQQVRREAASRGERIRDVQTALRAEIRSYRRWLESFDIEVETGTTVLRMENDPSFTPFIPREVETLVFNALVGEIHILPSEVIDPIVLYYRQVHALAKFAEDLRGERFEKLEVARKVEMYKDYVSLGVYALDLADETIATLSQALDANSQ